MIQYHKNAHYSPDGVICVTREEFVQMIKLIKKIFGITINIIDQQILNSNEIIILLELKSPVNRFVHHFIDKPCMVYEDQIKTGTSFLDVDIGLFSESTFKILTLETFFGISKKKLLMPNDEIPVINYFKNKLKYTYKQIRLSGIAILTTNNVEIKDKYLSDIENIFSITTDEEKFFKVITDKNIDVDFTTYFNKNDQKELFKLIEENDTTKYFLAFIP